MSIRVARGRRAGAMYERLLPYYEKELTYLRRLGAEFGARYPKIASQLLLEGDVSADPHVERMVEAFAFLSARVHLKLDDEFPEITEALLGILYPHYLQAIPSMSLVEFQIDPAQAEFTSAYTIPRGTEVLARPARTTRGLRCQFKTTHAVNLWPVRIASAALEPVERSPFAVGGDDSVAVLRLVLECQGSLGLDKLKLDSLRFFLDGEGPIAHALYELLFASARRVIVAPGTGPRDPRTVLPPSAIRPVGFEPDEALLDYGARSFQGYRLLTEYFLFPEKFLFFDLVGLNTVPRAGFARRMEIAIQIGAFERADRLARLVQAVGPQTFRLGCAPIVNLFKQPAEPINLTQKKTEYQVLPDVRRPWGMEVYSVDEVARVAKRGGGEDIQPVRPIFSHRHGSPAADGKLFYLTRRVPSERRDDSGTEILISFVDLDFNPAETGNDVLSMSVTATNRDLPAQLPFGGPEGDFDAEAAPLVSRTRCLRKPTPTVRPPGRRDRLWRLISHLSLNHLSLVQGGTEAFQEILSLYNFGDSPSTTKQISGLIGLRARPKNALIGPPERGGFARGLQVTADIDEDQFVGAGAFLFGAVLDRFLGLYCHLNSFTQLELRSRQREGVLHRWPIRSGEAILL